MSDLAGRYRLGDVIGTGGTATVYRARDLSLGVERAVKVLRVDSLGADAQRARLRSEARAMARVTHLNILRVYDVGTDGDQDFVVMELAAGGSLQDRLDEHGPLPALVACRYALQVLAALAAAHDAGVIHRDVKPQNVLLDSQGVAMLADFGIALLADGFESRHTRVGVAMGSMTYMPPEQRLDARGVGVGADIYACGATLYALLTGASPVDLFLAAPGSVRWEDVPESLRPVIQRATRLIPEERWASAREMAGALLEAMAQVPEDPFEHAADDQSWGVVRDRVLTSLSLESPEPTAETRRGAAPKKRKSALVDPTMIPDEGVARPPGWRRWGLLSVGLGVAIGTGAWAWVTDVAPRTRGGVFFPPRAPVVESEVELPEPVEEPAPAPTTPPTERPAEVKPRAAVKSAGAGTTGASALAAVASPVGRWTGSFAGRPVSVELAGSDRALKGTVTNTFQGNKVVSRVTGSFDPASRRLDLADVERADDSGRYTATLTDEPALEGRFEAPGRLVSFKLVPAP